MMVFVSGQVSIDADGNLVAPGDVAGQGRQVYANLLGYKPEVRPLLAEARSTVFGPSPIPASTVTDQA